jgi:hypothetical protein
MTSLCQLHAILRLGWYRGAFHKPLRVIFRTFQELLASWEQDTLVAEMVGYQKASSWEKYGKITQFAMSAVLLLVQHLVAFMPR